MKPTLQLAVLSLFLPACANHEPGSGVLWGNWRGPGCNGLALAGDPPVRWSEQENILFKTALPGDGGSCPVVWRDRVYVTSGVKTTRVGRPPVTLDPSVRRFAEPPPQDLITRANRSGLHRDRLQLAQFQAQPPPRGPPRSPAGRPPADPPVK